MLWVSSCFVSSVLFSLSNVRLFIFSTLQILFMFLLVAGYDATQRKKTLKIFANMINEILIILFILIGKVYEADKGR
ncbi:MAG: hypothetical protein DSY80_10925 [Desulfocapsa sp.]|nr:MAG: hypothetical protein DSY80_10925 [Desulfocapsa sp.]